jgi:hypothetical protein
VILLLNGAFGIGKTTAARALVRRFPRAVLYDPEVIGIALQRVARLTGRKVDDFQDLPLWRRLTIAALRVTRLVWPDVVVPMAFSNLAYLDEIRAGLARFEPHVHHFCLIAPVEVVHERLRTRGSTPENDPWGYRRAAECCLVHGRDEFSTHVIASGRSPDQIADELLAMVKGRRA